MPLFKNKYKSGSNRLQNWDYSNEGIYFITLATCNRECIFGSIDLDVMILNEDGKIIENEIIKSTEIRDNWIFHNWIVMPNHIHLLIEIQTVNTADIQTQSIDSQSIHAQGVETHRSASTSSISNIADTHIVETHCGAPLQGKKPRKPNSISSFVALFKSVTTRQINGIESIWQSNYHDHIVRNYVSFEKIDSYITNNPANWNSDSINILNTNTSI